MSILGDLKDGIQAVGKYIVNKVSGDSNKSSKKEEKSTGSKYLDKAVDRFLSTNPVTAIGYNLNKLDNALSNQEQKTIRQDTLADGTKVNIVEDKKVPGWIGDSVHWANSVVNFLPRTLNNIYQNSQEEGVSGYRTFFNPSFITKGAVYDGQVLTDEEGSNLINSMLWEYKELNNKKEKTFLDDLMINAYRDEFDKIYVPDTSKLPSYNVLFGGGRSKLIKEGNMLRLDPDFMLTMYRQDDRDKLGFSEEAREQQAYNKLMGISDINMTEDEFKNYSVEDRFYVKKKDIDEEWVSKTNMLTPRTAAGQKATASELNRLIYDADGSRAFAMNQATAIELYKAANKFGFKTWEKIADRQYELLEKFKLYTLEKNEWFDTAKILDDFISEYGYNPLALIVTDEDIKNMTPEEYGFYQGGQIMSFGNATNFDDTASAIIWNMRLNKEENDWYQAFSALALAGAGISNIASTALGGIYVAGNEIAKIATLNKDNKYSDMGSAYSSLYISQNSDLFTFKQDVQQEEIYGPFMHAVLKYISIGDDIAASFTGVSAVNKFASKIDKASKLLLKVEKAGNNAVKISQASKLASGSTKLAGRLADEAITSALVQGVVPYDYSDEDFIIDVVGGAISGVIARSGYKNAKTLFVNTKTDTAFADWYLLDVIKDKNLYDSLSDYEKKILGKKIKDGLNIGDDMLTNKEFVERINEKVKLKDSIHKEANKLYNKSQQILMGTIYLNPKYSDLVTYNTKTNKYSWNIPEGMSESKFYKKIDKISDEIDKIKYGVSYRYQSLKKILKSVNDDAIKEARKTKEGRKLLTKKGKGTYVFKDKASELKFKNDMIKKRIKKSPISNMFYVSNKSGKFVFNRKPQKYEMKTGILKGHRYAVDIYINDIINNVHFSNAQILAGTKVPLGGHVTYMMFEDFLQEAGVDDVEKISTGKLKKLLRQFAETLDEEMPKYLRTKYSPEVMDNLGNSKNLIINLPYDAALKVNPDLQYMSPEVYNRIRSDQDGLHPMEKEIILRGFVKSDIFDGNHMFLKGQSGEKLFNSVFEEKITLGKHGELRIKEGKKVELGKDMDISDANKYTYNFESENKGTISYSIYDGNTLIGYLETTKGSSGVRDVKINFILDGYEVRNPDIRINKTGELPGAFRFKEDLPRNIPVERLKVKIDLEEIGLPNTEVTTWKKVFTSISGKYTYENFMKILPGYTDRVPAEIFDSVITAKDLNNSQKIAIITSFMFNKNISETEVGISILAGEKVFNKKGYIRGVYEYNPKTKKFEYNSKKYTPGESDILYNSLGDSGYVRIQGDIYEYRKTKGGKLNLYKPNVSTSKPIGSVIFTNDSVTGYIHTQGRRHIQIDGFMDFSYNKSDDIYKYMSYDSGSSKSIKTNATYEEIYRAIYGTEISDVTLAKLKANRNMTPEKYLNYYIDNFRKNPFAKYAHIDYKASWQDIITQIKSEQSRVNLCVKYKNEFPNTKLTNRQIYEVSAKAMSNTPLTLTKAEKEIWDIMFDGKQSYSHTDLIHLYGYSRNGIVPEHVESGIKKRLKDRRKRIVNKLYGDMNLTEYEAEKLAKISIEDVTPENIVKDPEGYYAATEALYREGKAIEEETAEVIATNEKIVEESEPLIDEINNKLRKKKGSWKANKEYQKVVVDSKIKYLKNDIEALQQDRLIRLENGEAVADIEKNIAEKSYALKVLEEYSQNPEGKVMTSDEFNKIYEQNLNGNYYGDLGYKMSTRQLNANLNAISDNMGSVRILEYDYKTGQINTRGLNAKEKTMFKDTLQNAAYKIYNGEASALHLPMLHAIVIDPKNVSMIDVGHEWFHDAVSMMSDQKRYNAVINEAYTKFGKEIESYGASRRYREYLSEYFNDEEIIKKKLTEEWLAERFGEYVQGRSKLSDNVIVRFFQELYEKIRMLFSDTKIIDLFDDIYEGRIVYENVQRPLDIDVINKRSAIKSETRKAAQSGRFDIGDNMDLESYIRDFGVNDCLGLFDFNRAGRLNVFTSRKFDILDFEGNKVNMSFDDAYESIIGLGKAAAGKALLDYFDSLDYKELYNKFVSQGKKYAVHGQTLDFDIRLMPKEIRVSPRRTASFGNLGYGTVSYGDFRYDIDKPIDQTFFKRLSRYIYTIDTSDFNMPLEDFINIPNGRFKHTINNTLPDLLEMSVNEYKIGDMHESFKGIKNIDTIKGILDDSFRTSLFNRLTPHSNFETSKALIDKNYGLFRRKFERTINIMKRIDDLGDDNLKWFLTTEYNGAIAININFDYYVKDVNGNNVKRTKVIGWHMSNNDFDELYKNGYINKDEYDLLKYIQENEPNSMTPVLTQLEMAFLNDLKKPSTWNRSLLSTVSSSGGDNRFKQILKIANNNNKNIVLLEDMFGKAYAIQKGISGGNLISGINNGRFIGSSVGFVHHGVGSFFGGDALLIARKDAKNLSKGNYTHYSGDVFTVLFDNFIAGDIVLSAKDIISKGGDLISGLEKKYNIGIHPSIQKEIDKLIKLDAGTMELRSDKYKDHFPGIGRIIQNRKNEIAKDLIKDNNRIKRIMDESFKGLDHKGDNISKKIDVEDLKLLLLLGDEQQIRSLNAISENIFNQSFEGFAEELTNVLIKKYGPGLGGDAMSFEDLVNASYEYADLSKFKSEREREIFIKSALMDQAYKRYKVAESWTDYDALTNYHTIIVGESYYNDVKKALDDNNYKYTEVDRYELRTADLNELISDDKFILIEVPDYATARSKEFDKFMYVNKRGSIQLTDEYYDLLRDQGLTYPVTLKTKEKVAEDMRYVNKVLRDSGYNIKNDIDASVKINDIKKPTTEYINKNKLRIDKSNLEESVSNAKKRIADSHQKREKYKNSKAYKKLNEIGNALDSDKKAAEAFTNAGKKYDRNIIHNETSITGTKNLSYYDNNIYTKEIPAFQNLRQNITKYDYSDAVKITGRDYDTYSYVFRLVKDEDGSLKYVASTNVDDYNKVIDKLYSFGDEPVYRLITINKLENIHSDYKNMAIEYRGIVNTRDKLLSLQKPKELQIDIEKQIETDKKMYEPMASSMADASLVCDLK